MPRRRKIEGEFGRGSDAPDPIDVRFGATLRRVRLLRGVSQQELARAIGLTFQAVQKYEVGQNRVAVSTLVHIANALKVSPSALLAEIYTSGETAPLDHWEAELLVDVRRLSPSARKNVRSLIRELARPADAPQRTPV